MDNSKKPLVSIITPTFNRPDYLRETIRSAQAQTFRDFEHVVIDDNSPQDIASVVKEFHNPEVHYIRNEKNLGMSGNYNVGIHRAQGDYLALLEDDDLWLPNYLEEQISFLRAHPDLGAVYSRKIFIDPKGKVTGEETTEPPSDVFTAVLATPQIIPSVLVVKRSVVEAMGGFDPNIRKGTDWDFTLRVAKATKTAMNPKLLVHYRVHPGQLSSEFFLQRENAINLYLFMYDKFRDEYVARPALHADYLRNLGTNYCLIGKMRTGRNYFFKAIQVNPRRLKNYRSVLLSCFPHRLYLKLHAMKNHAIYG